VLRKAGAAKGWASDAMRLSVLVALPALAFIVAAVGMLWNATATSESTAFVSTPEFHLWLLIVCFSAAVWVLAIIFLFATCGRHRAGAAVFRRGPRGWVQRAVLLVAALPLLGPTGVIVMWLAGEPLFQELIAPQLPATFPLEHYKWKLVPVVTTAVVIGLLAIYEMWVTALALSQLRPCVPWRREPTREDFGAFLALRRHLTAVLGVAAVLIGLGTLSAGALRHAVLACHCSVEFAQGYVVSYGLLFSILLAIAFVPCFLAMRCAGARLRDCAHPLPAPSASNFKDVIADRKTLADVLQTNLTASATFKAGAAILTPFATSLLTLVLPGSTSG